MEPASGPYSYLSGSSPIVPAVAFPPTLPICRLISTEPGIASKYSNSHLCFLHVINKLQLALCHIDDLLN